MQPKKICKFCNKNKATAWFHSKRICQKCWDKIKNGAMFFKIKI